MPQLIVRGMEKTALQSIRKPLVDELTAIIGCPRDYFNIELVTTVCIGDEAAKQSPQFVQVNWFDRGQAVQDQTAEAIDRHIRSTGYEQIEIFFLVLCPEKYYENGQHY